MRTPLSTLITLSVHYDIFREKFLKFFSTLPIPLPDQQGERKCLTITKPSSAKSQWLHLSALWPPVPCQTSPLKQQRHQ
jgi:hypothetical protein